MAHEAREESICSAAKPRIIFAPETFNLAEVTRLLAIAERARRAFDITFLSYDGAGRYHGLIERAGFALQTMEPTLTEAEIERFWRVNRMQQTGPLFSDDHIEGRVRAELELCERIAPVAVVSAFCLSTSISARVAGLPLVTLAQTTWLAEFGRTFARWPDFADFAPLRIVPSAWRDGLARRLSPRAQEALARPFNRVARRFGIPSFEGSALYEGDHVLFAEPEGFSGLTPPQRLDRRHAFIGPLVATLDGEIPATLERLDPSRPVIYFAMGSSGDERSVIEILDAFGRCPWQVIAPVRALIGADVPVPSNVHVTSFLPAHRVNRLASVSVVHGGIGTLFNACISETPVVGVGNGNPEQEYNIDCLVRLGLAERISRRRLTAARLLDAIERALRDDAKRERVRDYGALFARYDSTEAATRYLEALLLKPRVHGSNTGLGCALT